MPQYPYPARAPRPGQGGRSLLCTFPEPRTRQGVSALLSRLQPLQGNGTHSDQGKAKVSENTCKYHQSCHHSVSPRVEPAPTGPPSPSSPLPNGSWQRRRQTIAWPHLPQGAPSRANSSRAGALCLLLDLGFI